MRMFQIPLVIGLTALVLGIPAVSGAQLVVYDDFSAPLINPDKWAGSEATGGTGNPTTEVERIVQLGRLEMRIGQYGLDTTSVGTSNGKVRLGITNPGPITTIQSTVTVVSVGTEVCEANTTPSESAAYISGDFFNDGSSTGAGDATGDVVATLYKLASSTLGNVIRALISRCNNPACSAFNTVGTQMFTSTWTPGDSHTLTVTWDAANNHFIFSAKPARGSAESHSLPYSQSDSTPPVLSAKQLLVASTVQNCVGNQKGGAMVAQFDTVMVNP